MNKILTGRLATASRTRSTMTMIIAVPRSGWTSTRAMGIADMIKSRKTSPGQALPLRGVRSTSPRPKMRASTANSDGCSCNGPRLNQRAATWALLPIVKHPHEGEDDQPVQDVGDGLEPPVIDKRDHHHGDDPQHHEKALLLQEGLGVVALGQERPPCGGVDHHHSDDRHQQGGGEQNQVERRNAATGGNVCSGECGHNADSGTEYRP